MSKSWKSYVAVYAVAAVVAVPVMAWTTLADATPGGNSAGAKVCQKGGWQQVVRADDTAFKNQGECVSYAAGGGTLTPALPDLVPVLACDHSGCTLSVQNVGNAVANGSIGWALDISEVGHSGNACSGNAAISLAPSATSNVVGSCSGVVEGLSPIAAIATASVDTANAISESDETNNTTSQPFTLFPA